MHCIDICHLSESCDAVKDIGAAMIDDGFKEWFVAEGHDGQPMADQIDTWESIVNKHFPSS
jgi:hypothetical protein